ncbi:MAG: ATP-grasp domain-containing protein [Gaiellales bacterium]
MPAVWDDSAVEWDAFDLVVLRSTWDYAERRDEFLAWAKSLPRVENPVPMLEWNTDKRYLEHLAAAGVPIVPTQFVAPGAAFEPPAEPFVVKPSVSAGGRRSAWFEQDEIGAAQALVARIHAEGRTAMIQPYLADAGETALVYIDGAYSHALSRCVPLPSGGDRSVLYLAEELAPAEATAQERTTAENAIACAPGRPCTRASTSSAVPRWNWSSPSRRSTSSSAPAAPTASRARSRSSWRVHVSSLRQAKVSANRVGVDDSAQREQAATCRARPGRTLVSGQTADRVYAAERRCRHDPRGARRVTAPQQGLRGRLGTGGATHRHCAAGRSRER